MVWNGYFDKGTSRIQHTQFVFGNHLRYELLLLTPTCTTVNPTTIAHCKTQMLKTLASSWSQLFIVLQVVLQ